MKNWFSAVVVLVICSVAKIELMNIMGNVMCSTSFFLERLTVKQRNEEETK